MKWLNFFCQKRLRLWCGLDCASMLHVHFFSFFFGFFFLHVLLQARDNYYCSRTEQYCSHIVAVLFTHLKILKMGQTVLCTYLKIILLQCFQFLVLTKLSCIQTDPKSRIRKITKTTKGGGLHMFGVSLSCFLQKMKKSLHINARSVERNILLSEHMVLEI